MKLSDIRNDYFTYSTRVSEIIRKLNFAGLALLWILSHEETESFFSNKENFIPLRLLVFSMVIDVLQYLIQSIIWYVYYMHKRKELLKNNIEDVENVTINENEAYNIIPWCFWGLKILFTLLAFIFMAIILLN